MNLVECELARLVISENQETPTLFILKEKSGERSLTVGIHIIEALAINRRISGEETPRPMTHDLLCGVIQSLGAKVEKIAVSERRISQNAQGTYHTFYGLMFLRLENGDVVQVDCRPSDAMAVAVREECPIYVAEDVFD